MKPSEILLAARERLAAKGDLDLHPGEIAMLPIDLARWSIDTGRAVRCIGVKGIGRDVAVRVVRL